MRTENCCLEYGTEKKLFLFTFDLELSNGVSGTKVQNDIVVENIPPSIFTPSSKPCCVLRNPGYTSALKYLNPPFLIEDKEVNSSLFIVGVFG